MSKTVKIPGIRRSLGNTHSQNCRLGDLLFREVQVLLDCGLPEEEGPGQDPAEAFQGGQFSQDGRDSPTGLLQLRLEGGVILSLVDEALVIQEGCLKHPPPYLHHFRLSLEPLLAGLGKEIHRGPGLAKTPFGTVTLGVLSLVRRLRFGLLLGDHQRADKGPHGCQDQEHQRRHGHGPVSPRPLDGSIL
jgi:hypothetical protein